MAKKSGTRSESGKVRRVIVVGGGLAGLMTVIKLCEAGVPVDLFSLVPVKRSHSVCAQGGINASVNTKGEGDSPQVHLEETVYGGDFLANQPPVKGMCDAAPGIVFMLDRMGVPVQPHARGAARLPPLRRDPLPPHGVRRRDDRPAAPLRARRAGAPLGDGRRRGRQGRARPRREDGPQVRVLGLPRPRPRRRRRLPRHRRAGPEVDGHPRLPRRRRVPRDRRPRHRLRPSTNSVINTGTAASAAYQQGACYANGEFIQVHPTAIPGADKLRLISESVARRGRARVGPARRQGAPPRARRPRERARLLPRGEVPRLRQPRAARHREPRALQEVLPREARRLQRRRRSKNENEVYLDVTHLPREVLRKKLAGVLEIYEKFVGEDPYENPMRVFPAVHYSMGGLWVDFERAPSGVARHGLAAQPGDEHPGPLRGGRGRLPVPRRQPPRRELAPLVPLGGHGHAGPPSPRTARTSRGARGTCRVVPLRARPRSASRRSSTRSWR